MEQLLRHSPIHSSINLKDKPLLKVRLLRGRPCSESCHGNHPLCRCAFRFLAALRERTITLDKEKIAETGLPHVLSQLRHYYTGSQIFAISIESNSCPLWICSNSARIKPSEFQVRLSLAILIPMSQSWELA